MNKLRPWSQKTVILEFRFSVGMSQANPSKHDLLTIEQELLEVGLTKYEARALLTLFTQRDLSAEEISKQTGIPYPRVYDTMEDLEKKGLIEIIPGRPRRFMAIDPRTGFANLLKIKKEEFDREIKQLEEKLDQLVVSLNDLFLKYHTAISPEDLLQTFPGLGQAEQTTTKLILSAKREVLILTNVFLWYQHVSEALQTARESGVSIRVLMNAKAKEATETVKKLRKLGIEARNLESRTLLARGTLKDNDELLFVIWASDQKNQKRVYRPHYTQNPGLIEIFRNNFEFLWAQSK